MTGYELCIISASAQIPEDRRFHRAVWAGDGAARMENAARGRIQRRWKIPSEEDPVLARVRVRHWNGGKKGPRVRVLRIRVEPVTRGELRDFAQIHHGDAVRDVLDDLQIVGDEEIGQLEFFLQIFEQVQDLRLDGDIER